MTTRRQVLAGAAAVAGAGALRVRPPEPVTFAPGRPILIRRATVVPMDPTYRVLPDTDVLVRGTTIEAVGQRLSSPPHSTVLDADGALLLPGFIDTHRHMWQTVFRAVGADWTLTEYFNWVLTKWGPLFRPEDIYASNYMGMVEAIDNGVTTVMDWSHGLRTPEHADAAVDALFAMPGRARFGYGNDYAPSPTWVLDGRVDHMLTTRFASQDQLVTMQLAIDFDAGLGGVDQVLQFARDRNLPVSNHIGAYGLGDGDAQLRYLADNGALSPSFTLVHANTLSDDSYRRIADSGAQLSISAESELNAGQGYPPTAKARQHHIQISLSQDTMVWWNGDMFAAMRATLNADRGLAHLRAHEAGQLLTSNELRAEHVLGYATIGGARVLGLDHIIGSITPGKRADLVLLGTHSPAMTPTNNPAGHIVFQATRGDVDTVLVNGRVVKHRGTLVGVDLPRARRLIEGSLDYLRTHIPDEDWHQAMGPPSYRG